MQTFVLVRQVDETGVSGTGKVAEGAMFSDGTVAMRWLTTVASTTIYPDIAAVELIHGHDGSTKIEWTSGGIV